jgi:PAS domain S-box-containing protein
MVNKIITTSAKDVLDTNKQIVSSWKSSSEQELKIINKVVEDNFLLAITDVKGKIIYANDNFSAVSGYSKAELLGQDHRILNSGHHTKEFFKDMWDKILAGETWKGEICNKNKNGDLYWVDTIIAPKFDNNINIAKIIGFISIRYEITDKMLSKEQLIQKSKLAALGKMAAGMAHEINNPVAIIKGKVELMLKSLNDDSLSKEKFEVG